MTESDWRGYNAGASKILQELMARKLDWPETVDQLNQLNEFFNRVGVDKIKFNGDRVHDRLEAEQEKEFRRRQDIARVRSNRTDRYQTGG